MSSSQASSDDFPRLTGSDNFNTWKARMCAALDGKHLLSFVMKPDYDGVSEEESDAVGYEDSDDGLKPLSQSDDDSGDSNTTTKAKKPATRAVMRSVLPSAMLEVSRNRSVRVSEDAER
ncbi:hypothetical protein PHMEG_00037543 [Phytophthora megakarya]|uniref:Uncharacterized protein n=1 Tax=Phytophthora megakarya TaxID=4795 RepID=A0A225UJL2_9STRA|nr:hypothetical protein PHMEG_00037543 [Phytophthora megakarya]